MATETAKVPTRDELEKLLAEFSRRALSALEYQMLTTTSSQDRLLLQGESQAYIKAHARLAELMGYVATRPGHHD